MSHITNPLRAWRWAAAFMAAFTVVLVLGGAGTADADLSVDAAEATITVDGDNSDWASITGVDVTLSQPDYTGTDFDEPNEVADMSATVKMAMDSSNIYVLYEVDDDYDYDPNDHNFSAALAVMFLIDAAAGPHMGADDPDYETGLGMVDIWHWELDCDYSVTSGGGDTGSGDDPDCNLDDEFATDPETREDDGGGDTANAAAENSISGIWEHSGRASGVGTDGTWTFELSRPLQTGDPEDAQFAAGGTSQMALAYFDADESLEGWTDTGHLTSADEGWITVNLPGTAQETPTATASPGSVPSTGGSPDGGGLPTAAALLIVIGAVVGVIGASLVLMRGRDRAA